MDHEVTTITSTNLVPRALFLTSKAKEKPPGDEVAHQRQRERQKSNITLKSKSTTFHGNHALLYISSPSGFPFRKWSLAFFKHFLLLEAQSVSVKKKKDRIPGSNPDLQTRLVTQNSFFLFPSPSSRSRSLSSP